MSILRKGNQGRTSINGWAFRRRTDISRGGRLYRRRDLQSSVFTGFQLYEFGSQTLDPATALSAGAPVLSTPAINQTQVLTAVSDYVYGADRRFISAAIVDTPPTFSIVSAWTATPLVAGAPVLGTPALGQVLAATALADSAPTLGTPVLRQVLVATALADSAPTLGTPAISQVLTATALADAAPSLGTPAIGQVLTATALADGAPTLDTPAIGQGHVLAASAVQTAVAVIDVWPAFSLFSGSYNLTAVPIIVGSPIIGVGVFPGGEQFTIGGSDVIDLFPVYGDVVYTWDAVSQRTG